MSRKLNLWRRKVLQITQAHGVTIGETENHKGRLQSWPDKKGVASAIDRLVRRGPFGMPEARVRQLINRLTTKKVSA